MRPYEILDHPADLRLRIYGADREQLFLNGATALFETITDLPGEKVKAAVRAPIQLERPSPDELFMAWLRELLYLFDTRRWVLHRFRFSALEAKRVNAEADGFIFDPRKHNQKVEVKAVTRHGYRFIESAEGLSAEVILDI